MTSPATPPPAAPTRLRAAALALARFAHRRNLTRLAPLAAFVPALLYAHNAGRFFARINGSVHFDDAYVVAVAARMVHGRFLPYVDAACQRGPLFYWLAAAAQAQAGWTEWTGVRALAYAAFLLTACALFAAGVAARRAIAGAFGALLFVFVSITRLELKAVFGMVSEPYANLFATAALALVAFGLRRERRPAARVALLALAGAASACAALCKQTYLLAFAPYLAWALAAAVAAEGRRRERFGGVAALALGWALPFALVALTYALAGELDALVYWSFTYNREVYMAPYRDVSTLSFAAGWAKNHRTLAGAVGALTALALARAIWPLRGPLRALPQAYDRNGFAATIALQIVLTVASTFAAQRPWSQYYLPPVPWLALFAGIVLADAIEPGLARPFPRGARLAAFGLGLVAALGLGVVGSRASDQQMHALRRQRRKGGWSNARPEPVCAAVDAHSRPDEPLFVWGFDGDIYLSCRRRPASRYVYTTLVAGIVPPFWGEPKTARAARNAARDVIADLERERPPLVLDTSNRVGAGRMRTVKPVDRYVQEHYCRRETLKAKDGRTFYVWVRNDRCTSDPGREAGAAADDAGAAGAAGAAGEGGEGGAGEGGSGGGAGEGGD